MKNFLFALILLFPLTAHAELKHDIVYERVMSTKTIRCGYNELPPFVMADANTGKISGVMKDLMDEIGRRMGVKVEWTEHVGWGEVTTAANSNKIDMFCNPKWPDKAQYQNMTLSRPFAYTPTYAFVRADDKRFDNNYDAINDPKITISGIDGDTSFLNMQDKFPKAKMQALPNMAQSSDCIVSLVTKKADLFLSPTYLYDEYNKTNPGKIKMAAGKPLFIMNETLVTRAGEQQFKNVLDNILQALINEGFIEGLFKKYNVRATQAPKPDVVILETSR